MHGIVPIGKGAGRQQVQGPVFSIPLPEAVKPRQPFQRLIPVLIDPLRIQEYELAGLQPPGHKGKRRAAQDHHIRGEQRLRGILPAPLSAPADKRHAGLGLPAHALALPGKGLGFQKQELSVGQFVQRPAQGGLVMGVIIGNKNDLHGDPFILPADASR